MKQALKNLTFLRAVLLVLVLILALWFVLFGAFGFVNIGIIVGFLLLALLILFWPQVRQRLKALWKKRGGRVLMVVLFSLLGLLLVWMAVLSVKVVSGMRQPKSNAETVIVLGCQVRGEQPSRLLAHRIDAAADYLTAHPQAVCIVSGGQGSNESISEAECMRRGLVLRGIAEDRIYMEDRSTSTKENLRFSKALIEENGLPQKVLLVSNNFHLYRALQLAKAQQVEAEGLPAACEWYMLPPYIFREVLALMLFRVFG